MKQEIKHPPLRLDRNVNPDGAGKYSLINNRVLKKALEDSLVSDELKVAVGTLGSVGAVSYGNESPGEQFFVMKYKDQFTAPALMAYADAVRDAAISQRDYGNTDEYARLMGYAMDIYEEAARAKLVGNQIPT